MTPKSPHTLDCFQCGKPVLESSAIRRTNWDWTHAFFCGKVCEEVWEAEQMLKRPSQKTQTYFWSEAASLPGGTLDE